MADDDLIERTGKIDGKPFKVKVSKTLTDDEVIRRVAAQRMPPRQTTFGEDVAYGAAELGIGAVQLGEMIGKKAGLIPEAPTTPPAPQGEGVVTEAKVKEGTPQGMTGGRLLGNLMSGAAVGGVMGAGLKAVPALGSLGRNVIAGGLTGALQPVEGSEKDYWKTKGKQAATGAMLGYGFSVAGKAANVGVSALMKWLAPRAPGSTEDVAIMQILDRINMGSKYGAPTAQQMMELMERAQAAGKPMTMADVGDKNLLSLAGHTA